MFYRQEGMESPRHSNRLRADDSSIAIVTWGTDSHLHTGHGVEIAQLGGVANMWTKLVGLAIAGAVGTLFRYGITGFIQGTAHSTYPWGTFTVNAIGCFLFGLIWTLTAERMLISSDMRMVVLTGFLGSFTTFSAFLFETDQLIESSQWLLAGTNVVGNVIAGLAAYLLGAALARLV